MTPKQETRDSVNILIVDDQKNWQDVFMDILANDGYCIEVASTLTDALSMLEKQHYNVVVIDLRLIEDYLFGYQGFSVINHAREKGVKTIICTGFGSPQLRSLLIRDFNIDGYIEKNPRFRNTKFRITVKKLALSE
jgi:DNA-binding NtrC family response regulator